MEYSPPPLFKQGASARAKVVFFSLIAFGLLIADSHFHKLAAIRQVVGTALYPLQMVAVAPRDAAYRVGDYFVSLSALKEQNRQMRLEQAENAQRLQQATHLLAENTQLRKLLGTSERLPVKAVLAELLYDARDAFTRKIVLDRGTRHGVALGQPVIDDIGVVGQVTRVFPFSSEVTLLTDKDQAIPVQVLRSGLRSVAYGGGQSGLLDLRFMASNADIQNGDMLVTSGIDGVYPAGLAVAKVTRIESKSTDAFAHILCQPAAGVDRNRQLLILLAEAKAEPRLPPEETRDHKEKGAKKKVVAPAAKTAPATGAAAPGATDAKAAALAATGAKAAPAVTAVTAAAGARLPPAPDAKRATASAPAAAPASAAATAPAAATAAATASPKPSPKGADR
jgi:rod shape-determining protein MreC